MKDIYTMLVKQCIKDHGDEFQSYHHAATPAQASDNESTITMRERRISGEATSLKSRKSTDGLSEHSANDEPVRRSSFSSDASFSSDYRFPSLSSKKAAVAAASDAESKPLTGFVYAPTTTTTATITATATATTTATTTTTTATTTTKQTNDDVIERKSSLHNTPYAKKGLASRRGSKDSCESMGTGLTTDDLIDKLLADDPPRSDEHIATIFITFFRRFMKPGDLARALIDRFDSDGLLEPPPTRLQERIQAIFLIWLTSYWNDFHSRRTRKTITNFLERISKEQVLRPISDSLTPLANRMPPDDDPDAHWGMADDDNEDFDDQDDAASDSSDDDVFEECEGTTMDEMEEAPAPAKSKKDSGYSSESFVNFFTSNDDKPQDSKSISEGCYSAPETSVVADPPSIKRTASVSSFSLFGRPRKSSITSSLGFLFSFAPMTAAKPAEEEPEPEKEEPKQVKEEPKKEEPKKEEPKKEEPKKEESKKKEPKKEEPKKEEPKKPEPESKKEEKVTTPPTPPSKTKPKQSAMSTSSSAAEIASRRTSVDARSTTTTDRPANSGTSSRTEFAGGLINIDSHCGMSTSPSWTSFGANTISSSAASFISVFGGYREKPEKDQLNYNYKVIMEIPDQAVADQLTWIESELFGKIKAREFVRNIWSARPSSVSSEDQLKCHSAVVASIAHFNFISAWVATIIVTQPKLNKRAALLEKFMSIAVELRNHNNYNSLMAVLAGLNSASVLRMKQTREAISDKKIYKQFQSLERLMSSDRSFSSYRLALKASEAPGIPYLGIHNQDLVSLAEGNKDFRPDGTIHWEKFRLMGECIVAMMKFQCPAYDIDPDGKILHFIADTEILSEDEQYKRSNLVEPRLKSSSTNRLRDLWLRV
ncbi:ras guanine nucleotide exchange factor domain-containing protein [Fennellomyces sp. T-0311]|nr:ras guanine nucleotide exchange factor domain-containing protein [Fennellomyces sp. T-0311]